MSRFKPWLPVLIRILVMHISSNFQNFFLIEISPLSLNEMRVGGLIRFGLKDHDLFGRNDYLGEVYFPLVSIPHTTSDTPLKDLPQRHLLITKPTELTSTLLQTLENRIWDKTAVDFVKKERNKISPGSGNSPVAGATSS